MDDELRRLDQATAEARQLASAALEALAAPQAALRVAAGAHVRSVAQRTVDQSRHASVVAMGKLTDDEVAELRSWTIEQVELAGTTVERDVSSCGFWIEDSTGLSPTDVTRHGAALVARPKDSPTGVPQALVQLFEEALSPLRRGLAEVGFAEVTVSAEPAAERSLLRAWLTYRERAIECLSRWADVDERYHASSARYQELRWENAGSVDLDELREMHAREAASEAERAAATFDAEQPAEQVEAAETARSGPPLQLPAKDFSPALHADVAAAESTSAGGATPEAGAVSG